MRGSTPLDVAAASCIDNNELALALQEQDLEMVLTDPTEDFEIEVESMCGRIHHMYLFFVTYLVIFNRL